MSRHEVEMTVNGRPVSVAVQGRTHLADALREALHLTGTHLGCEHGVCGACTLMIDGVPQRGCLTLAAELRRGGGDHDRGLRPGSPDGGSARELQRPSRPAVRLLHARHADDRLRSGAPAARRRMRRGSARSWPAISAAAPATTASSRRSGRPWRRPHGRPSRVTRSRPRRRSRTRLPMAMSRRFTPGCRIISIGTASYSRLTS